MKKLVVYLLVLSLALMVAGCAAPVAESIPSPSPEAINPSVSPAPSPTASTRELVFDAQGKVIEDERGLIKNGAAAVDGVGDFTLEEIIKLIPYTDGALSTAVYFTLAGRLLKDFDNVISQLAASEDSLSKNRLALKDSTYLGIGFELKADLDGGLITDNDCQVLYAEHKGLTQREQNVLDKIIESFEKDDSK